MESRKRLSDIIASWNVGAVSGIVDLHEDTVYRIDFDSGDSLILKDIGEDAAGIRERFAFECEVLRHLSLSGVPVALPIPDPDGKPFVERAGRLYTLSPFIVPEDGRLSLDHEGLKRLNYGCGRAIAELGIALAAFPVDGIEKRTWSTRLAEDVRDRWMPDIRKCVPPEEAEEASRIYIAHERELTESIGGLPMQLIHRDCHQGNIVVRGEHVVGFIDTDHLSLGPGIFDLVYFIVHMIQDGIHDPRRSEEFFSLFPEAVRGYHERRPLSAQELRAFFPMMLALFIMYTGWFYEIGKPVDARAKARLLYWVNGHEKEIKKGIMDGEPNPP